MGFDRFPGLVIRTMLVICKQVRDDGVKAIMVDKHLAVITCERTHLLALRCIFSRIPS